MDYDLDLTVNRKNTNCIKWDGGDFLKKVGFTERFDDHTISMFVADMDFLVAKPIKDAMQKTLDHGIFGYTIIPETYYQSIVLWMKKKYDWDVNQRDIIYSPGTINAIDACIKAFSKEGDQVIIQRPVYNPFSQVIKRNKRELLSNDLIITDHNYTINFEEFEAFAKQDETKLFILCNPHNPVGKIYRVDDLRRLSDICQQNDVLMIADEVHADLIRTWETFTPLSKAVDDENHIITCTSINKTFNVAGLHCTNVVIKNDGLRKTFKKTLGHQAPSPFVINTLIAAYNESDEWLTQIKSYIDDNFKFAITFLETYMPRVKTYVPEGTYLLWMDFSGYNMSFEEIHHRIYHLANVVLEDGKLFDPENQFHQRMVLATSREILEKAFMRLYEAFEK